MTGLDLAALAGLGAFHGLNPGMGWLFAVALGLQGRSLVTLLRALPPIAAGHAVSVVVVAAVVTVSDSVLASRTVAVGGGVVLVGFGLWKLLSQRHFRWAGMRLSTWQLASWSFLMSSVHGAGLMLLPVLVRLRAGGAGAGAHATPGPAAGAANSDLSMSGMHMPGMGMSTGHPVEQAPGSGGIGRALLDAGAATAVHTVAMVTVAGVVAVVVYQVVGLRILRSAWVNLDRVWAFALVGAGAATMLLS